MMASKEMRVLMVWGSGPEPRLIHSPGLLYTEYLGIDNLCQLCPLCRLCRLCQVARVVVACCGDGAEPAEVKLPVTSTVVPVSVLPAVPIAQHCPGAQKCWAGVRDLL